MELTLQNRKILLASMVELQQAIDESFIRSELDTYQRLMLMQKERVIRLGDFDTRYGDRGTSADSNGIG